MPNKRWTIAELETMGDQEFIRAVLNERRNNLSNPYAPLSKRIDATLSRLTIGSTLWQFQCQREGSLFYYQHSMKPHSHLVTQCPLCGSTRIALTGRTYPAVDEASPSAEEIKRAA